MKEQLLHTPDGVRDIYNGECKKKLILQDKLHQVLLKYGYQDIQTPTFEFFNIFSSQIGTTPSRDLYKFFDKEGNTLVLRPDFTPSIARSAAKYYMDEQMPVKLCYIGNTFTNSNSYQGRLKEITQSGAELIGDGSTAADAEILAMVVDSLKTAGLSEFQISIGHAQFFGGLVKAAGLQEEEEAELRSLISNKNFFGVEEFVDTMDLEENLRKLFYMLGNFDLKIEEIKEAKKYANAYPDILEAIVKLEELDEFLKVYGIDKYISYELGIISNYHYYTGIIFYAYTFGTGEPIVKGGRYDKLLEYFGKAAPSIGFAIVVDQLMSALSRQKIEIAVPNDSQLIVYEAEKFKEAVAKATQLRKDGQKVEMLMKDPSRTKEDYNSYSCKNQIKNVIWFQ